MATIAAGLQIEEDNTVSISVSLDSDDAVGLTIKQAEHLVKLLQSLISLAKEHDNKARTTKE